METLQGTVTRARHTTHVSGNGSRTTTQHIAILEIGGVLVTYRGSAPVLIERGDEVRVVGMQGNGERTLDALAYYNLSRDVEDDSLARPGCACGVLLMVIFPLAGIAGPALVMGDSPLTVVRDLVPPWVVAVAAALLVLAIANDRRRARYRDRVLKLLDGD
jgi:hypothetical protein